MYSSKPSAATWPDCSSPSRLPAPRSSRSRIAIWKPEPSSVKSDSAASRCAASARQRGRGVVEHVGVGALAAAPDAPADLVELGEAEVVGALDDQRVGGGDVDPRLDDRGADQHVGVAAQERHHPRLELVLLELAVGDLEAHARAQAAQARGDLVDRLDAVVQVERLAAARALALERLAHQRLVVLADVGAHRAAALGRGLDHRDVAQAGERHLQRARDRRRRHRDHVDAQAQLAQPLLLLDAEALLLVDDHQPEVLRAHVAREQPVGADQDVELARRGSARAPRAARPALRKRETCSTVNG